MDTKKYIESGILDNYVLGILEPIERKDVEDNILKYPELKTEVTKIEVAFEKYAQMQAIQPPAGLEALILSKINNLSSPTDLPKEKAQVPPKKGTGSNLWSVLGWGIGLLASTLALLFYMNKSNLEHTLNQNKANHQIEIKECDEEKTDLLNQINILRNIDNEIIAMGGTDLSPTSRATVYNNKKAKKAYLDVNDLPQTSQDKQYQLWAIVDGKPVDMGVFEIKTTGGLQEVPFIAEAQAFAVTLEKRGGNPTPTLDQMYVVGEV